MQRVYNTNAVNGYFFDVYDVCELTPASLRQILSKKNDNGDRQHIFRKRLKSYKIGNGRYSKGVYDINMAFDIETSTVEMSQPFAFMYIWQMSINETVIIGRTWSSFIRLLDDIKEVINPTKNQRVYCFVHNLGFEFQFMRKWLNVTDAFLKDQRTILFIEHNDFVVFRDSYALTNQSLKKLAETYTNTRKCAGDLDYNLVRHNHTLLTDNELMYCYNDVLILSEFATYYFNEYCAHGFAPLTATSIINKEVNDLFNNYSERFKLYIKRSHPQTFNDYMWLMSCVYRGGFVHGNELAIDEVYTINDDVAGFDFTSSYPAVMLYERFGYNFRVANLKTIDDIFKYINDDYAVLCELTFYNIKRTGIHSIESFNKCMEIENPVKDNGRICKASKMRVALTELDLISYTRFYKWERVEVTKSYIARKEYLPRYLIDPLVHYYTTKNKLKLTGQDETLEYKLAKARCNSFYGLCVKQIPTARVCYDNNGWSIADGKDYEKCKNAPLLPYFGVYISAYARYNLLSCVWRLEKAGYMCAYMDTDSIKVINYDDGARTIIEEYNDAVKIKTEDAKERLNIPNGLIDGLGEFDAEYGEGSKHGRVTHFKTLGAKRYVIITEKGHKNQTIAGLPKNIIFDLFDNDDEVIRNFNNNLTVNDCKLRAVYNDEEMTETVTDYIGETLTVSERSNLALVPTDFTLSLDRVWLNMLLDFKLTEHYYYNRHVKEY